MNKQCSGDSGSVLNVREILGEKKTQHGWKDLLDVLSRSSWNNILDILSSRKTYAKFRTLQEAPVPSSKDYIKIGPDLTLLTADVSNLTHLFKFFILKNGLIIIY